MLLGKLYCQQTVNFKHNKVRSAGFEPAIPLNIYDLLFAFIS